MCSIRVFVSSPRDVGNERAIAAAVIERLRFEFRGLVELEPVFWEQLPMRATGTFQVQIPEAGRSDICVFILWSWFGTPLPDTFRKPDGSLYQSGTEFEFESAIAAHRDRGTPDILVYRKTAEPRTAIRSREEVLEQLAQRDAVQAFIERYFRGEGGTFKAAFRVFENPAEFEEMLEAHLRELVREHLRGADGDGEPRWTGSPFRGLQPFDVGDALIFCGRTRAVGEVIDALHRQDAAGHPLVLIAGASGSGKSSLARAGVLHMLTQPRVVERAAGWRRAVLRPGETATPVAALAAALLQPGALPELAGSGLDAARLASLLRDSPAAVPPLLALSLSRRAELGRAPPLSDAPPAEPGQTLLALLVDQLEELFAPGVTDAERAAFACALAMLAESGAWIVLTLRADFHPRCAELPERFRALIRGDGLYELPPPGTAEIAQMIRRPAQMAGLRFERRGDGDAALDDLLCEAAAGDRGALPLLQFALEQLYERSAGRLLRFADYDAMGGLEGAVGKRAEAEFARLVPEARAALPLVLSALVRVDPTVDAGQVAQRRARRAGIDTLPGAAALVDAFVAARLFVVDADADGQTVVSLAHEALLRAWPRARDWIAANRAALAARSRVTTAEALWRHAAEAPDLLLAGPALREAAALRAQTEVALLPETQRFIALSERAAMRRRRRARLLATAVAAGVLGLLGGAGWYWDAWIAPHRQLYPDTFTRRFGVWTMAQAPITPADASHRNAYLRVTTRGRRGPVVMVEVLNGSGFCPLKHDVGTMFGSGDIGTGNPCRWDLRIADGRAIEEVARAGDGHPVWSFVYSNADRTDGGYFAPAGYALPLKGNGISRVRFDRSPDGLDRRVHFEDAYGHPQPDAGGAYGMAYTYDAGLRVIRQRYLGSGGDEITLPGDVAAVRLGYDGRGRTVEIVNEDAQGRPVVAPKQGIAVQRIEYDEHGNVLSRSFFDEKLRPIAGVGGWAGIRYRYDDRGNAIETRYVDASGKLFRPKNGFAIARFRFDARGWGIEQAYFDEHEQPVSIGGAYRIAFGYDAVGKPTAKTNLDAEGRPTRGKNGAVRETYRYDSRGRQDFIGFVDEFGKPVITPDGYSALENELDDYGNRTRMVLLGADGRRLAKPGGSTEQRMTYDERGNQTSIAYYDAAGQPTLVGGVFRKTSSYDDAGRLTRESFAGVDGQLRRDGSAVIARSCDTAGNEVETSYLDGLGHPLDQAGLCARVLREFDGASRETSTTCVGPGGVPLVGSAAGFARHTARYDAHGNRVDDAYFDAAGKPMMGPIGYASLHVEYDGAANPTEIVWRDAEGRARRPEGGCGHVRVEWDEGRNKAVHCVEE